MQGGGRHGQPGWQEALRLREDGRGDREGMVREESPPASTSTSRILNRAPLSSISTFRALSQLARALPPSVFLEAFGIPVPPPGIEPRPLGVESTKSYPLDQQGSPPAPVLS